MPKEGKHDRFSRELRQELSSYFAPDYAYKSEAGSWLLRRTPVGSQRISVLLSGANAPLKHLEFRLGLSFDAYQSVVSRFGLNDRYPNGCDHFWNTTFNCKKFFRLLDTPATRGMWSINLNSPVQQYVPDILPVLGPLSKVFFETFSAIGACRDAVLRHDGTLFQSGGWERIALADLAMKDFGHLRQFAAAEIQGWGLDRNEDLWQKIRDEFVEIQ